MTHPLNPPPEQLQFWKVQYYDCTKEFKQLLTEVAQWGWDQREPEIQAAADAELEACCEWVSQRAWLGGALRAARRPKLPSLKEQAYAALDAYIYGNPDHGDKQNTYNTIRRALEALSDD